MDQAPQILVIGGREESTSRRSVAPFSKASELATFHLLLAYVAESQLEVNDALGFWSIGVSGRGRRPSRSYSPCLPPRSSAWFRG